MHLFSYTTDKGFLKRTYTGPLLGYDWAPHCIISRSLQWLGRAHNAAAEPRKGRSIGQLDIRFHIQRKFASTYFLFTLVNKGWVMLHRNHCIRLATLRTGLHALKRSC